MAKLTKVGNRATGQLTCPRCGGASFTAKRGWAKWLVGILAPKSRAECVACGARFRR